MQLVPSALAQTLRDDISYTPNDVLKMAMEQKRADKLIKEQRQYETLNKLYDTTMPLAINDYGIYSPQVHEMLNESFSKSVEQVKNGGSAADTVNNYSKPLSLISKINQFNADERKFAEYIDSNPLMSAEGKKKAKDDRARAVAFNDDGTERVPEDAFLKSKELKIEPAKYIDNEAVYEDFLSKSKQSITQKKEGGGISSKMMYMWQKEDKDGNIVPDVDEQGLVSETVYAKWMESTDRADKAEYEARKKLKEIGGNPDNTAELEKYKRAYVSGLIVAHGDEGTKSAWEAMPASYYRQGTTKTMPYNYYQIFKNVNEFTPPPKSSQELEDVNLGKGVVKAQNVSGMFSGLDAKIKVYVTPNGEWWASRYKDELGMFDKYVKYDNKNALLLGINPKVAEAWEKYNTDQGIDVNPANNPTPPPTPVVVGVIEPKDYIGKKTKMGVVERVTKVGGNYFVWIGGRSTQFKTKEGVQEALGPIEESSEPVGKDWDTE